MKVFICVLVAICAMVAVDGKWMPQYANMAAEIMKRSMSMASVNKRQQKKECCLPSSFSTSGTVRAESLSTSRWSDQPYQDNRDFGVDISYSGSADKLYAGITVDGQVLGGLLISAAPNEVELSAGFYGQCAYEKIFKFRDSYLTNDLNERVCLPEPIANYAGNEQWNGVNVDVYNIYNGQFTAYGGPRGDDEMSVDVKMRALRQADGGCIPVQVTFKSIQYYSNTTAKLGFTSVPQINSQPNTARFQSAC
jgi:hypothetical protein